MRAPRVNDAEARPTLIRLGAFQQRGGPDGAIDDADERQVAIKAFVVEAVSDNEYGRYREADVVEFDLNLAVSGLVQKGAYLKGGGGFREDLFDKHLERDAGVHDVLNDEDLPAAQALAERVGHIDGVLALFDIAIDVDEFHGGGDIKLPDEVRKEADDAVQRADTYDLTAGVVGAQLLREFPDAAAEASGADEDAIDALGGGGGEGRRAP